MLAALEATFATVDEKELCLVADGGLGRKTPNKLFHIRCFNRDVAAY